MKRPRKVSEEMNKRVLLDGKEKRTEQERKEKLTPNEKDEEKAFHWHPADKSQCYERAVVGGERRASESDRQTRRDQRKRKLSSNSSSWTK